MTEFLHPAQIFNRVFGSVTTDTRTTEFLRVQTIGGEDGAGVLGAVRIQDRDSDKQVEVTDAFSLQTTLDSAAIRQLVSRQFVVAGSAELYGAGLTVEVKSAEEIAFHEYAHRIETILLRFSTNEPKTITCKIITDENTEGYLINPFLGDLKNTTEQDFAIWNDAIELGPRDFFKLTVSATGASCTCYYRFIVQALITG